MGRLLVILLLCGSLHATTYFVATAGSDGAAGTSSGTAWATISKVNGFAFACGDTVQFNRGDTWDARTTALLMTSSPTNCTSVTRITITNYGSGNLPIIDGFNTTVTPLYLNGKNFHTVDGLQVQGAGTTNGVDIQVNNCDTCIIRNNTVRDSGAHGIFVFGVSPNTEITGNTYSLSASGFAMVGTGIFLDSVTTGGKIWSNTVDLRNVAAANHTSAILCRDVQNCSIKLNTIQANQVVQGIGMKAGSAGFVGGWEISQNSITGVSGNCSGCDGETIELTGFPKSGTVDTTSAANSIVTQKTGNTFLVGMAGQPIIINSVTYTVLTRDSPTQVTLTTNAGAQTGVAYTYQESVTAGTVSGNFIQNSAASASADCLGAVYSTLNVISYNLCLGNALQNNGYHFSSGADNNFLYNNTTYSTGVAYACFDMDTNTLNNTIKNNICKNSQGRGIAYFTGATGTYANNDIYNSAVANFLSGTDGGGNITTDPKFVNNTPASSNDMKLLDATSPCANAAQNLGSTYQLGLDPADGTFPYNTANQNLYGVGWEIGAFVVGSGGLPTFSGLTAGSKITGGSQVK